MAVAFLDVAVYVTSLAIFKNLVLIGDHVKSLWFVAFQVRTNSWSRHYAYLTCPRRSRPTSWSS